MQSHFARDNNIPDTRQDLQTRLPKLIKIAASVLCQPLPNSINNSLSKDIFPDDAKIVMVSSLNKGTYNKNDISNFGPVSILTTLSKIFDRVPKN